VDLTFRGELASGYHSWSQIGRVLPQDWVGRELPCLRCSRKPLTPTPENTRARDFNCDSCGEPYELKSTFRKFSRVVPDGQFDTFRQVVSSDRVPNIVLLEYDREQFVVRNLTAIHRTLISPKAIRPRHALSQNAQRAGWRGCGLDLGLIPLAGRVRIVESGRLVDWPIVREAWKRFEFMIRIQPMSRGWNRDILALLQTLPSATFRLDEAYRFEKQLRDLHPQNLNIRPKIRQQLQVLVAQGVLRRERPGTYTRLD
jgi:type II restriction enzyme